MVSETASSFMASVADVVVVEAVANSRRVAVAARCLETCRKD